MNNLRSNLVAHRGYSLRFPENTLVALKAALGAGAMYLEFDVHLSKDSIPIVIHDNNLRRTTGVNGMVTELTGAELSCMKAGEILRLGEGFANEPLPTLANVVTLIKKWPKCQAFVEIKRASIGQFGVQLMYQKVFEQLQPILSQCIMISYDFEFIRHVKQQAVVRTAWVFEGWNTQAEEKLVDLQPQFAFTDWQTLPTPFSGLWQGNWQWVLYVIDDVATAQFWLQQGVSLVETNDIGGMLGTT